MQCYGKKRVSSVTILLLIILSGCGGSNIGSSSFQSVHHSATLLSIQNEFLNTILSFKTIQESYGNSQTFDCDRGGTLSYTFSEDVYPVTLSYANCQSYRLFPDGNDSVIQQNGQIFFTGNELNTTITFQGDFNHTTTYDSEAFIAQETNLMAVFNTGESGLYSITVENLSTINFTHQYESTDPKTFLSINNLKLRTNFGVFRTEALKYNMEDYGGGLAIFPDWNYPGEIITESGEIYIGKLWKTREVPPKMVAMDNDGNFMHGGILYYKVNTGYVDINIGGYSVDGKKNIFFSGGKRINVSPYLW